MSLRKDFILLVPVYNPSDGWEITFKKRYDEFCDYLGHKIDVVLINDGSTKNIDQGVHYLVENVGFCFRYIGYSTNKGKGGALKHGVSLAKGSKYMFTDIDFPYTNESMKTVWETLMSTDGIVTGYRQEAYYSDLSLFRTTLSKSLRWLNKTLLALPVNDTQCGLKAFDEEVKDLLLSCKTNRFLIDLELLLAVNKQKLKITPVQVSLRQDIDFTKFKSSVLLKEVFNFLRIIIKYRIYK